STQAEEMSTQAEEMLMPAEEKCPIQEVGTRCSIINIDGLSREDYIQDFIESYRDNEHIDFKSVVIEDFLVFFNKELHGYSSRWSKYNFVMYLLTCDSQLNPIDDEDYVKNVVSITETILNDISSPCKMICLISCNNSSIEETVKSTDDFVIAALHRLRFKYLLQNLPSDLIHVFNYVKSFC
ncbi:hypothetical protein Ahia01_000485400, partial [Argonauta hians]